MGMRLRREEGKEWREDLVIVLRNGGEE